MAVSNPKKQTRKPGVARPGLHVQRAFEVLARLASHTDLSAVDEVSKHHILVDAWAVLSCTGVAATEVLNAEVWAALEGFHQQLRSALRAIYSPTKPTRPRLRLSLEIELPLADGFEGDGGEEWWDCVRFHAEEPAANLVQLLMMALVVAINSDPFPLERCWHCGRMFVRGTDVRRLYCSRTCTLRAADERRAAENDPEEQARDEAAYEEIRRADREDPGWDERAYAEVFAREAARKSVAAPLDVPTKKRTRRPPKGSR